MRFPLSMTLLLIAGASASVGACGPNVILDGMSSGTGSGGSTTGTAFATTGLAEGGASVTTTVGIGGGVSSTSGFGGGAVAVTNAVSVGTGGFTVASSVAVGTGGVSVATATSTGTGVMGACTDGPDEMYLDGNLLYPTMVQCAFQNLGNTVGETNCLQSMTGLSPGCVGCVVEDVLCSLKACSNVCAGDPNGASCTVCRNQSCEGAFLSCSGLPYAPGSTTCEGLLFNGEKGTGWQNAFPIDAFIDTNAADAYDAIEACACGQPLPTTCVSSCNGSSDFCNGGVASTKCFECLDGKCGSHLLSCMGN